MNCWIRQWFAQPFYRTVFVHTLTLFWPELLTIPINWDSQGFPEVIQPIYSYRLKYSTYQGRIQDFLIGGEPNNLGYRGRGTNERSELRAKRVTSEASIISWGYGGRCKPPENFFEFRTPESESEHNLTFHNLFVTFVLRIFWKIFFMIIDLIFEDNNETINNITLILLLWTKYFPLWPLRPPPPTSQEFFLENFSVFSVFWGTI